MSNDLIFVELPFKGTNPVYVRIDQIQAFRKLPMFRDKDQGTMVTAIGGHQFVTELTPDEIIDAINEANQ